MAATEQPMIIVLKRIKKSPVFGALQAKILSEAQLTGIVVKARQIALYKVRN
jgi:hypothetical protein